MLFYRSLHLEEVAVRLGVLCGPPAALEFSEGGKIEMGTM